MAGRQPLSIFYTVTHERLNHAINTSRQLTQGLRGRGLSPAQADEITSHLLAAQKLAQGRTIKLATGKLTRRRTLWRRDPRCFWCGRLTVFEEHGRPDSATLDHLYSRLHPRRRDTRKHLPSTVLACYCCNQERGAPAGRVSETCPVVDANK